MKKYYLALLLTGLSAIVFTACKKTEPSVYAASPLTTYYMPLAIGKYITYRMDSLTYYYFGQSDTISSYLAKDIVEDSLTDGSGRKAWLVNRYLSDTAGLSPWVPTESYTVTPTGRTIEVLENNLRFIKLKYPMSEGDSWSGNSYLPKNPYQDEFLFSSQTNINPNQWTYVYQHVNQPVTIGNQTYDSASSILEVNDSSGIPIIDTVFASKTYWSETYAKNTGMIQRQTIIWEYQPEPPDGSHPGYKIGFGLNMWIVDHN